MNNRVKKAAACICTFLIFNFMDAPDKPNGCKSNMLEEKSFENNVQTTEEKESKRFPLIFKACEEAGLDKHGYKFSTQGNLQERPGMSFGDGQSYASLEGVTCFRGNNMRDGGSFGNCQVNKEQLKMMWVKEIGSMGEWSGVGWNGQPAVVKWNEETMKHMNMHEKKKQKKDLKEVIYATLDGNVYFLDLEDGKETREKLTIGAPVKGSVSVDPRGIPLLYVGQGISNAGGKSLEFAYRIFSLNDFSRLYEIKGSDSFASRGWGAFDSTALVDSARDYLFICGENGMVYSGKLNARYENGIPSIKPDMVKYKYSTKDTKRIGIENSIAVYGNHGFFADNDGVLQCLDMNNLKPVWTASLGDDTDSTVVLERNSHGLDLYTACEVDWQGNGGFSFVRKFDGTDGKLLWEKKYKCAFNDGTNGGALATPVLGKKDISGLVIFNIARHPGYGEGILVALDKNTGEERWKLHFQNYCWSSPVCLYTGDGKSYIVQCDSTGKAMLIEGTTGKILHSIELGSNVEGTPAAFGNYLVVGTRGSRIIGFRIE